MGFHPPLHNVHSRFRLKIIVLLHPGLSRCLELGAKHGVLQPWDDMDVLSETHGSSHHFETLASHEFLGASDSKTSLCVDTKPMKQLVQALG